MPTVFNADGKPGYVYDSATDTWYQLSGKTDTSGGYEWGGSHTFLSTADFLDHVVSQKGINNFLNPAARDLEITSPVTGSICLIRQDGSGNIQNELQFYDGSAWQPIIPSPQGNSLKFLQSNGTIAVWSDLADPTVLGLMMMGG